MTSPNPTKKQAAAPKRQRIDFNNEVTVLVGLKEKRFIVHQNMICATSEFFKAACNGKWSESKDKTVRLSEQKPKAFDIWLNWRYTGTVDLFEDETLKATWTDDTGAKWEETGERTNTLIDSFILGDVIGDRVFRNALMDTWIGLIKVTNQMPGLSEINLVFKTLPKSSKLRACLADELAFGMCPELFAKRVEHYDPQVWQAIAEASVKYRHEDLKTKKPRARGRCFYHEHENGQPKCS